MSILDKIYDPSKRVISSLQRKVEAINAFESEISKLSDSELKDKTAAFKEKLKVANGDYEYEQAILEDILPEAFAVLREAMKRVWGERHFNVQLIGGIVLHQGKIAEMKTGEGKTIVAALPIYLNALAGRGVHLVTVNDYLSKHHGEGMGEVYNFLGLTVGIIQSNQSTYKFVKKEDYSHYSDCDGLNLEPCSRKEAYACDITYGTNNEYGFDYLRDNMAPSLEMCVQREVNFAIVDEVDSILIDEARTPLIISGQAEQSTSMYQQFSAIVPKLKPVDDYVVDEKERTVSLTDKGLAEIEKLLHVKNIYDSDGIGMVHHLEQALKAHALFKRDKDYVVQEGEIIIVDEFTGRLMVGRRYSEGLHQAIEAKEGVEVKNESQTLATISFQNLFRLYNKLSGMTATAATEAEEFYKIYKLDVVEIPTNKTVARQDLADKIFKTEKAKIEAIVAETIERNKKGQPVLIGTASVEKNELLSESLKRAGVKHEVLNAKNHEREAKIITKAGEKGAVTVATNMAGRGTDIKLQEGVKNLGGLFVLGTERHESRRIDNQLRGRAGRQGDPGASQFFVSLEDDLMRIFGGEKLKGLMDTLGLPDDMPIENKMISRSIETAQKRVEGYNFDTRKHLVEYDDVMNKHREVVYKKRRKILETPAQSLEIKEEINDILDDEINDIFLTSWVDEAVAKGRWQAIFGETDYPHGDAPVAQKEYAHQFYEKKEKEFGSDLMRQIERAIYLRTIDMLWIEHLTTMDELRTGIGLRGYGQRDPLVEYKQEAYNLFEMLLKNIEANVIRTIFKVEVNTPTVQVMPAKVEYVAPNPDEIGAVSEEAAILASDTPKQESHDSEVNKVTAKLLNKGKSVFDRMQQAAATEGTVAQVKHATKIGRNDPCPCGATKADGRPVKYKHCCGK